MFDSFFIRKSFCLCLHFSDEKIIRIIFWFFLKVKYAGRNIFLSFSMKYISYILALFLVIPLFTFAQEEICVSIPTKTEWNIEFFWNHSFQKISHTKIIVKQSAETSYVPKTDSLIDMLSEQIWWSDTKGTRFLSLATNNSIGIYKNLWFQVLWLPEALGYDIWEELLYGVHPNGFQDILSLWNEPDIPYTSINHLSYTFIPQDEEIQLQIFPVVWQDIELNISRFCTSPRVVLLDPVLDIHLPNQAISVGVYNKETEEGEDIPLEWYSIQRKYSTHQYTSPETKESFSLLLPYYDISFTVPKDPKYSDHTLEITYYDRATEDPSGYTIDFMDTK